MAAPHDRPPGRSEPRSGLTDAQKWTLGGLAAVVVLILLVVSIVAAGDDDDTAATTTTTTSTTTTSTTTTTAPPETTETTLPTPAVDPYAVAFPSPEDSRSFQAPAAAARAYATDVLGFTELVLGAPDAGGDQAEVVVQPTEDGPETRIALVRSGDAWYVTGSQTDDIVVDQPAPGTSLATPFETTGQALAFEGNVQVLVFDQQDPAPIGDGAVIGSGSPPAGPFQGDIQFRPPAEARPGILVYRISSAKDGAVLAATSLRVRLTPLTS